MGYSFEEVLSISARLSSEKERSYEESKEKRKENLRTIIKSGESVLDKRKCRKDRNNVKLSDLHDRVMEMHNAGMPSTKIAQELGYMANSVADYIRKAKR